MDAHIPDALVTGHEPMIAALALPDPDDRHVLAAAIQCGAMFLVTKNLKDFPPAALMTHGIVAIHPDAFVLSLLETNPDAVIEGVRAHRGELVDPARSPTEYIAALDAEGMIATAAALRQIAHSL
jgi:hypothetical protein